MQQFKVEHGLLVLGVIATGAGDQILLPGRVLQPQLLQLEVQFELIVHLAQRHQPTTLCMQLMFELRDLLPRRLLPQPINDRDGQRENVLQARNFKLFDCRVQILLQLLLEQLDLTAKLYLAFRQQARNLFLQLFERILDGRSQCVAYLVHQFGRVEAVIIHNFIVHKDTLVFPK